ncbi:uncharacterized protein LOC125651867 isoform X2 [Ostrea edulis]|uniref:uncharacterized protein LOC125651867 isoform X2 n=1 Tax=Ostrea edulis TaxID=37623 RepID=UPI0024AFE8F8|nr:uncharacterized protein LOC125651867 isoform X2 [Ostrea edulis]
MTACHWSIMAEQRTGIMNIPSTQTPLENLFHYVHGGIHGLNDYTMAKKSGAWESGFQPVRNFQSGQQAWTAAGSVGQLQRQTTPVTYTQQIGTIGTITNGPAHRQPDHLFQGGSQQTTTPNIYPPYQQYTTSSVGVVRAPAQQNQFIDRAFPPSTKNNHCSNPTAYTTLASSGVNQNMHLRSQPVQPFYSQEMAMLQVPHQPAMSQTSHSQGQAARINVSEGQSGMYRNFSMPPRPNFSSQQGYTEISSHGSQANHGMRPLHTPNVNHQRPPYPFHPTQRNSSQFDPPLRNVNLRHHVPSTSRPQFHPAFRPSGSVHSMVNPLQMSSEQLQSSQDWQCFQQKATIYAPNIPHGPILGFYFHCRQFYEHHLRSVLHPNSQVYTFHDFCEEYLKRQEKNGAFKIFPSAQNTADVQENEKEPSDRSLLGQWYRHPDENQIQAMNPPVSSVNNINNDCVLQSTDHVDIPVCQQNAVSATTVCQDDHVDSDQEYIITPTDAFKVEVNENWESEQSNCTSPEREMDNFEREVEDIEDAIATNEQDDSEKAKHLTIKLPFHPPSKSDDRRKSLMSADQNVISNKDMQKLSEVVNKVMVNMKNTVDPSPDTVTSTAEAISESSFVDCTRTPIVAETLTTDSDLSRNEKARYTIGQNASHAQQNKTNSVTKRKHSTAEVDPEHEIQSVNLHPSKKQRKETSDENPGVPQLTNDNQMGKEIYVKDVVPLQQTKNTSVDKSVFSKSVESEERGKADMSKNEESGQKDPLQEAGGIHSESQREPPQEAGGIHNESQREPPQEAGGIHSKSQKEPPQEVGGMHSKSQKEPPQEAGGMHSKSQREPPQEAGGIHSKSRLLFLIKFHGEEVLCINCEKGHYLLMREILKKNFVCLAQTRGSKGKKNLHSKYFTDVFLAKERDLNIPYKELPEDKKSKVKEYMTKSNILTKAGKGNHIGIIHINDAHRLYQYFFGLKNCRDNCIQLHHNSDRDWMLPNCETGSSVALSVVERNDVEREAVVSFEYESDATIPYTEGSDDDDVILLDELSFSDSQEVSASKMMKTEECSAKDSNEEIVVIETSLSVKMVEMDASYANSEDLMEEMKERVKSDKMQDDSFPLEIDHAEVNDPTENGDEGEIELREGVAPLYGDESEIELRGGIAPLYGEEGEIELRGGIAPLYGGQFRFLVIDGIKFYPFADLCKRFDVVELTACMKMRKDDKYRAFRCEQIEADFLNRLEPLLPKIAENATLLEEDILFDIAQGKTDVDKPDESQQLEEKFVMSNNPEHPDQATNQNRLPSAEPEQKGQISNFPISKNLVKITTNPDDTFLVREMVSPVQNEEDKAVSKKNRILCTPVHNRCSSSDVEICQTNEVSSTMQTPISEEKEIQRNLAQDFTAAEEQQTNIVESSSSELDCCDVVQNSTENNNNSQNASDAMLNIGVLQKVQKTLSSIPPTADTTQIHQALQEFFKTCRETSSEAQKIVTEAFVSVLKQNMVLQNELSNLRSGIADLKEDKGKWENATKKCKGMYSSSEMSSCVISYTVLTPQPPANKYLRDKSNDCPTSCRMICMF